MARKKETITLSIPPGTKAQLEAIASSLDIKWGNNPSISGLVVAIAQGQVNLESVLTLGDAQVAALSQAIRLLVDSGYIGDAQTLVLFLLERASLETPLRQLLLEQVSHPTEPWRRFIDQQISNQEPFRLVYEDSQKQQLEFTVRYCEIRFWEKRFYVEAWCEELSERSKLPELLHNRCFRLDRIINILPVNGDWRKSLDYVDVKFKIFDRLMHAYEAQQDDIEDKIVDDARYIVRRVSNTFWFIREIFRYGENCLVLSPESVKSQLVEKLASLNRLYSVSQ